MSKKNPVLWRILSCTADVTGPRDDPPEFSEARWHDIEADNSLFEDCRTAWDVEDQYLGFWNRLNEYTETDAEFHYLHRPSQRVIVLRVEKVV